MLSAQRPGSFLSGAGGTVLLSRGGNRPVMYGSSRMIYFTIRMRRRQSKNRSVGPFIYTDTADRECVTEKGKNLSGL